VSTSTLDVSVSTDVCAVCYALRLRLLEYADQPEILKQMAKRALDDAKDAEGGAGARGGDD
jgi:hypothetical protein